MITKYKTLMLIAVLLLPLVFAPMSHAALRAFSPNPATLNGVSIGGIPAWYQDQNGVSISACVNNIPSCGLIGLGDPMFNESLPLSYPGNFPSEAFYTLADAALAVGPADARVVLAMEYTFIDAVTGALIGAPPRPATALGAPFQRHRLILSYPPGVPVPTAGNFTITHPWGATVFPFGAAKCVNNAGGTKCSMTQDLPAPGAIPPSFAAALGTGVIGSMSTFLKDPIAPAGFLGTAAPVVGFTDTAGVPGTIGVTDPLGNTGSTTSLAILVGQLVGIPALPSAITFPAQKPGVVSATQIVTITNPDAVNPATLGPAAITGVNAADFVLIPGTPVDCVPGAALPAAGSCSFGVTFSEAAPGVNGVKSALISFPVTTPLNMPPTIVNLSGTIDNVPPTVVLTLPANGATNWPANNRPHVTFSEPVTGISSTTFTIKTAGGVDVGGTPTPNGDTIADYALPAAGLTVGTSYTATLTTGITDIAGNPLAATSFSFTAGAADTTPPSVRSTNPANNTTGVRAADPITVTFTGSVDPGDVNSTTFFLSDGVTGTVTFDQTTQTATLKPDKPLEFFHKYTGTIKGGAAGITSLGQVPMAADFTWSFFTNGAPSAPDLFLPADHATGVALPVQFQWVKSKDDDGEPVSYHLWYCTNPAFLGCSPVDVAGSTATAGASLRDILAGLGGYGAGMLLAGIAIVGGVKSRRKIFFFIAVLAISGMVATACSTKTNTETVTVPVAVDPTTLITKSVSGLKTGTTYYWKVVADDGNGALIDSETRSLTIQ